LGVAAFVRLLVDTGADATSLHWGDRLALASSDGVALATDALFPQKQSANGIAGAAEAIEYGVDDAVYLFRDENGILIPLSGSIKIALDPRTDGVPSLLGRDLLQSMRLDHNLPANEISLYLPEVSN
jgi:hypothetical protein